MAMRRLAWPGHRRSANPDCWVVLDLETSGLDTGRDALLAIGAVALGAHRIVMADSLDMVVRPAQASSRSNILVHGLGAQAQRKGVELVNPWLDLAQLAPALHPRCLAQTLDE